MTCATPLRPLVLASASPERCRLLRELFDEFEVVRPGVDEEAVGADEPEALASRRAEVKALDVAGRRPRCTVIAADTLVVCRGRIIGKPADMEDAVGILRQLCSYPHRVITGVCIVSPDGRRRSDISVTRLVLRKMSESEIRRYVNEHDTLGKAGAYALELDDPNIVSIEGSVTGVMGLPLENLKEMLESVVP